MVSHGRCRLLTGVSKKWYCDCVQTAVWARRLLQLAPGEPQPLFSFQNQLDDIRACVTTVLPVASDSGGDDRDLALVFSAAVFGDVMLPADVADDAVSVRTTVYWCHTLRVLPPAHEPEHYCFPGDRRSA